MKYNINILMLLLQNFIVWFIHSLLRREVSLLCDTTLTNKRLLLHKCAKVKEQNSGGVFITPSLEEGALW